MSVPITAVVLAAGRSSRMGHHKLLLPLGGVPLVSYAVTAADASRATSVVVVLGYDAAQVQKALPPGRHTVAINPAYAAGMAGSLKVGVAAVPAEVVGALILLADQPLVQSAHVNAVLAVAEEHPRDLVVATYGGRRSHPVYFPRRTFAELEQITGDEGGRSVLANHAAQLRLVPLEPPETALDVDRPEEYARLLAMWPNGA